MIKEISFDIIKLYWKILWPDIESKYLEKIYLPQCEFVSKEFISLDPNLIPSIFLGYFVDNKLIGVLSGYKTSDIYFRTRGLWVNSSYRLMNVGTKLIQYIEQFALDVGCERLWTIPRKSAINFYLKNNFLQITDFIIYNNQNCYAIKTIEKGDLMMDKLTELNMVVSAAAQRFLAIRKDGEKRSELVKRDELYATMGKRIGELREAVGISVDAVEELFTTKINELRQELPPVVPPPTEETTE